MISGLVAPGALGLGALCGGRLVYCTLSTSAISPSFIFHIRSSTAFSTSSQRAGGCAEAGPVVAGGAPARGCAADGPASCANAGERIQKNPSSFLIPFIQFIRPLAGARGSVGGHFES